MNAQVGAKASFGNRFMAWWDGREPGNGLMEDEAATAEAEAEAEDAREEGAGEGHAGSALHAFRERFLSWWEGYDAAKAEAEEGESGSPSEGKKAATVRPLELPAETKKRTEVWPPDRIKIVERIWGAGFTGPGGAEFVLKLVKAFALNPEMSFLDLGAGLGGPARAVSEGFKMWVTAMEPSEALVARAVEESTMAGMAKKVAITAYDPESVELRKKGFDCIFALDTFFTVVNKRHLFTTVAKGLKKGGQLLFTDYMAAQSDQMAPETENWAAHEPVRPELWSIKKTREFLEGLKLEIRIEDDMSDEMQRMIMEGWADALTNLKPGHIGRALGEALIEEAEMWARRLAVLESGDVRLYRIHALKR